jgi:hypothetical protein
MPSTLRSRLNELAISFSAGVLDAIRGASLEELLSESSRGKPRAALHLPAAGPAPTAAPRGRTGRLPRRSAGDISQAVEKIVGLLSENPDGLRAEQIRQKLDLEAKELPRPLKEGVEGGRLSKVGSKRATTYFAGPAPSKGEKTAPTAPRAARRRKASASAKAGAVTAPKKKSRAKKASKARKTGKTAGAAKRRRSRRAAAAKA